MPVKYIFIIGGVVSGLGKGITTASLGKLLEARGYSVTIQKLDAYINIDPGTMSPYQHGEVFVTGDGAETDLDIGHYERFIDKDLTISSNTTAGKIYWSVLNKERKGEYLGSTIQVIPHITNEIKSRIYRTGKTSQSDIVITEIGGTVGDIECLPFLEAIRQVAHDIGRENTLYVHVTLIPHLYKSGELKTKPTQHSVKELLSLGIQPDMIVCRTHQKMLPELRDKLALFCNVEADCIIDNLDCESVYEVPLLLEEEQFAQRVCQKLSIESPPADLMEWRRLVVAGKKAERSITIGLVGKYVALHDAYLSVAEALAHGSVANGAECLIRWIDSETLDNGNAAELLSGVHGVLVPGGFGGRGTEGMIAAGDYAREAKIPFFGIGMGMQCAVIGFARQALGFAGANSAEIDPDAEYLVIDLMPERRDADEKNGVIRLGAYPCKIKKDSLVYKAYKEELIYERHRHRYELNNQYRKALVDKGLIIAGLSPDERLVEAVELPAEAHPWFVGVQYQPEFKSRLNRPHPLFMDFIKAALENGDNRV